MKRLDQYRDEVRLLRAEVERLQAEIDYLDERAALEYGGEPQPREWHSQPGFDDEVVVPVGGDVLGVLRAAGDDAEGWGAIL